MSEYKVIQKIFLTKRHLATGLTKHYIGNILLSCPYELRIGKYEDDPGYYLFHFDKEGKEMTDTYHDSLQEALKQAEIEFNITFDEWEILADEKNAT